MAVGRNVTLTFDFGIDLTLDWTILFLKAIYIYGLVPPGRGRFIIPPPQPFESSEVSSKKRRKGNPVPGGIMLFLGDINTGTWPSRLEESQMRQ
jgi:hypothetical protein